jgi:hypothetical protein
MGSGKGIPGHVGPPNFPVFIYIWLEGRFPFSFGNQKFPIFWAGNFLGVDLEKV